MKDEKESKRMRAKHPSSFILHPFEEEPFMAWPTRIFGAGALALGLVSGCYPWNSEMVDGGPHGMPVMMPEPNGSFVNKMQEVQVGKAQASNFVFFLDEWYKGGTVLGPYGSYHLNRIVPKLAEVPYPVVIQPSLDAALNEARRAQMVAALAKCGVAEPDHRVIVAFPEAEGLNGEEAPRLYCEMLRSHNGLFGYGAYGAYGGYGGYGGLGAFARPGFLGGAYGVNPFGY
jgi:hypothetical protein